MAGTVTHGDNRSAPAVTAMYVARHLRELHINNKARGMPGFLVTLAGDSVIYANSKTDATNQLIKQGLVD